MGKAMERSKVIYGEHKAVELKHFSSAQQGEVDDMIASAIGAQRHWDVDWMGVRAVEAKALKDPSMGEAHIKIGVIDGDLIWRAKENKFNGPKEYDAVLVKHYSKLASEQAELLAKQAEEESEDESEDEPDEFQAALGQLKAMPGYFNSLSARQAETKLAGHPVGSWVIRAGSQAGTVSYDRRNEDEAAPVGHYHIDNMGQYRAFKKFVDGRGKSKQIVS